MKKILKLGAVFICLSVVAVLGYGVKGYWDAVTSAPQLRLRADELIARGRGGESLGSEYLAILLRIQDPNFSEHSGVDFSTPGAGMTTVTQSVSKRLAFDHFQPGIGKIRQTGYALGLEQYLTKAQILALWLDTVEMGPGPDGWMTGFHNASEAIHQRFPAQLSRHEFLRLTAVLIAPATFDLQRDDPRIQERVGRMSRLLAGECAPTGHGDVWLEGCRVGGAAYGETPQIN
ncbi:MAG: transglycosylase domain-containing protein [Anaerolineales bacterium]|nr:transglycosylase domain-containing protein [Xanthobacteraceae bacterium]MCW5796318.1 transglycosylase domain-containing protein [Nitrospira sp.]MCW5886524.1 transglycosylase domain-containing protein [Anaerolineales bacterium]